MTHVQELLEELHSVYPSIPPKCIQALHDRFSELHTLVDTVVEISPLELYESQWALLGISQRAYELLIASVQQISVGNFIAYGVLSRAALEGLCSIVWARQGADRLPALVRDEGPPVGRLLNAGKRKYPDIDDTYAELSLVAHPSKASHTLQMRAPEEVRGQGLVRPLVLSIDKHKARRCVDELTSMTARMVGELREIVEESADVVRTGRVMVRLLTPDEMREALNSDGAST